MKTSGRPRKPARPYVKPAPVEPATVEHAVDEGILIAKSALTMEVKNYIIVSSLRDNHSFDTDETAGFVVHELEDLSDEQSEYAGRMDRAAVLAQKAEGKARHQHDYHKLDLPALTRRATIYRSLSERLRALATDAEFVGTVVEAARVEAWGELSQAIDARLETVAEPPVDANYLRDKEERIAAFLALDFAALTPVTPRKGRSRS